MAKKAKRRRFGEVRADGWVFRGYGKYRLKSGEFKERERWSSPKAWARQMRYFESRREWHKNYVKKHYKKNAAIYKKRSEEWYRENKEHADQRNRKYAVQNKDRVKGWRRAHYERNKERNAEQSKQWIKKNKQRFKLWKSKYIRHKLKTDIQFRLAMNLRTRLYTFLKGTRKTARTVQLLGCSFAELQQHLESQFTPKMSWENYGTFWEIDHIIPMSLFDLTLAEHQHAACHWTNLQPLPASENRSKGNRIDADVREDLENYIYLVNHVL
jgi:hypothetical protein